MMPSLRAATQHGDRRAGGLGGRGEDVGQHDECRGCFLCPRNCSTGLRVLALARGSRPCPSRSRPPRPSAWPWADAVCAPAWPCLLLEPARQCWELSLAPGARRTEVCGSACSAPRGHPNRGHRGWWEDSPASLPLPRASWGLCLPPGPAVSTAPVGAELRSPGTAGHRKTPFPVSPPHPSQRFSTTRQAVGREALTRACSGEPARPSRPWASGRPRAHGHLLCAGDTGNRT